LVVCPGGKYPLIPIHWPEAAARVWEENLTTVGGGILPDESPLEAMKRELQEEYSVDNGRVFPINHPRWVANNHGQEKQYVWCLVVCNTRPYIVPQVGEVAATGWYTCPNMLQQGVRQMSAFKRQMFMGAFVSACETYPEHFGAYVLHVGRLRRVQRKRKALMHAVA
jgi:8-oxo-dGTP pyrophosphatase MutT (NUDIX family)